MLSDIWVYTRTSKLMIGLLLLAALLLATQNWPLGLLFFIIVAGVIVYVKRSDYGQEKKLLRYLDDLSSGVSAGTVYAVKNLPVGIAMMDEKKELVWANNVFRGWLGEGAEVGVRFQDLITGQKISKIWGKTGWFECHAGESFFRVFYKFLDTGEKNDTHFMVFYFMDRTDVEKAVKACDEARPVFCLIRIDNVPEVTADLTDVERSALLSDVTEKVLSSFNAKEGFIKQYSTNDFVACISHKALAEMMESNFEILDAVRAIHTVNRIPVTLSIGIVQSSDSFMKQFEEAQVSLDLALGRGGDQAIVRLGKEVKAFGGKSPTSVSSTRVRVRVVAQALKEIIEDADMVLVMGHNHEDFDALGSAVGVAHLARASHVEAHVVLSKERDTCRKMVDAIEKSGAAEGLLIDESEAKGLMTDKTVVIITDTHIPELVQYYGGDEEMNELEASCLYAGIVVDTKNFAVQTSVRTFDAASFLRRCGADTKLVHRLFAEDIHFIKTKAEILAHMKLIDNYIAIAECPEGTEDSQVLAGQIADYLVTVKEIRTSFLFYHTDNGLCLSARSDGSINVQVVMEALGGGGHLTVAGCQLGKDGNKEAAEKVILTQVRKQVEEEKE